ncbi:hypothetical protein TMatcc_007806 [Talaromyces marneffei ATCC 18224]|uniref:uncharacterized protein n=1 Tax=Talaromyces marneffei TaxID=37727 RepID=UPI0012A7B655|nr:uncharacterized protein EYB26_004728 [Talaromyces marneffei]QGA17058.1 hypothetical protein EYB26_004728 [Talaromyces marneffei]
MDAIPKTPGGSASGSAVDVPAGFAILPIDVETIGTVPMDGVATVAKVIDSVFGMARSPQDLALITDAITKYPALPPAGYLKAMTNKRYGIRLGFLGESLWRLPNFLCELAVKQSVRWTKNPIPAVIGTLRRHGVHIQYPVSIPRGEDAWPSLGKIMREHEFPSAMDEYLEGLEHSKVHSPEEPVYLDSIGILTDSPLSSVATAAGNPICTMPLGTLRLNGRFIWCELHCKAV